MDAWSFFDPVSDRFAVWDPPSYEGGFVVQIVKARDKYHAGTQPLALRTSDDAREWDRIMSVVRPMMAGDIMREPPRMGFDVVGMRSYFMIKLDRAGDCIFVSPDGLPFAASDVLAAAAHRGTIAGRLARREASERTR